MKPILLAALTLSAGHAVAQMDMATSWDGEAGDGLWNSAMNWSGDSLPGEMDAVEIGAPGLVTAQSIPIKVRSLQVANGLFNNNGSLEVAEPSSITDYTIDGCCVQNTIANGSLRISGFSEFLQRPIFQGTDDVTIEGQANFGFGFVAQGRTLKLDGEGIILESQGRADSLVTVGGRVELSPTGSATSTTNGQWSILGGSIGVVDQEDVNPPAISALLDLQGGTIFSEGGRLAVTSNDYTLDDLTVEVSNGGRVFFQGGAFGADFRGATFRGEGEVWLDSNNIRIRFPATNEISSFGRGLRIDARIDTESTITNTGRMTMRGAGIRGAGGITTSGSVEITGGLDQDAPFRVTGGSVEVFSSITSSDPIEISGGEVELNTGSQISLASGTEGRVVLSGGTLLTPSSNSTNDIISIFTPTDVTGGTIRLDRGTLSYRGPGGNWSNGTIQLNGTGPTEQPTFRFNGPQSPPVNIADLTVQGSGFAVFGSGTSSSRPEIDVQGTITGNISEGNFIVGSTFSGPGTLTNNGNMRISDSFGRLECNTVNTSEFQFASGTIASTFINAGEVEQTGTLRLEGGDVLNSNEWITRGTSSSLLTGTGSFNNVGVYESQVSFGSHTIAVPFNNVGVLIADGNTVFVNNTPQRLADGTLIGGSWITEFGGRIVFPDDIASVRGPTTKLRGEGLTWPDLETIEAFEDETYVGLDGETRFRNGLTFKDEAVIELEPEANVTVEGGLTTEDSSTIMLNEGSSLSTDGNLQIGKPPAPDDFQSVIDDIEGVIAQSRGGSEPTPPTVTAPTLDLHGVFRPADNGVIADMRFHTDATCFETATWEIDISPANDRPADRWVGTGSLALGGTLKLTFASPPALNDAFEIVRADEPGTLAISGSFDAVEAALPAGLRATVVTLADTAEVRIVCAADVNADGMLNGADFNAWLTAFGNQDPAADQNGDGQLNGADFNAWLTNFGAGCS